MRRSARAVPRTAAKCRPAHASGRANAHAPVLRCASLAAATALALHVCAHFAVRCSDIRLRALRRVCSAQSRQFLAEAL
eukprot:3308453-Pleurochrysis_carterae.AAC.5